MPTEDEMTVTERRKYLKRRKPLYARAERSEQSRMLTEMEQVTGEIDPLLWNPETFGLTPHLLIGNRTNVTQ